MNVMFPIGVFGAKLTRVKVEVRSHAVLLSVMVMSGSEPDSRTTGIGGSRLCVTDHVTVIG